MSKAAKIIKAFRFGWLGRAKEAIAYNNDVKSEFRNRLEAIDILNDGAEALETLSRVAAKMAEHERSLAASKRKAIESASHADWWDMSASGWAEGGTHHFGSQLASVFDSLNEPSLAKSIRSKLCFQRSFPLSPSDPDVEEDGSQAFIEAAVPGKVEVHAALGSDWNHGQWGFAVSAEMAPAYSDYLLDHDIEHVFRDDDHGLRICFRTESAMTAALKALR